MITTSKNNSFMCLEETCEQQTIRCLDCVVPVEKQTHSFKKVLHDLWINILLFIGTDRWDNNVTLKIGDSHYTMKKDEIEARWRNKQI